jgi:hypothetical protein
MITQIKSRHRPSYASCCVYLNLIVAKEGHAAEGQGPVAYEIDVFMCLAFLQN